MTAAAITKPCTACKAHFIGLASHTICPDCEKDSEFYRLTRKKGDKRKFIPYPELFQQWKARRSECRDWRRDALEVTDRWAGWQQAERERSYLLTIVTMMNADIDPALALAKELEETNEALRRAQASATYWHQQHDDVKAGTDTQSRLTALMEDLKRHDATAAIPHDMRRRLVQLCHPDRHDGSEASRIATQWLLEGKP